MGYSNAPSPGASRHPLPAGERGPHREASSRLPTVGDARRQAAWRIAAALGETRGRTAALDARLIVAHALEVAAERLALADERPLPAHAVAAIDALVARRMAGEPVARIVGEKEFWSLPFRLSPAVLVPRPETETLVAAALAATRRDAAVSVLDIGTGSGAILVALLSELPRATGIGTDISPDALEVATTNAARLGVGDRCRFVATSWANGVEGAFHLIVANPPYIATGDIAALDTEVCEFDPLVALDGGADGLEGHRATLEAISRLLAPSGLGFVEIGDGQAAAFRGLAEARGLTIRLRRDLAGIERVAEIAR